MAMPRSPLLVLMTVCAAACGCTHDRLVPAAGDAAVIADLLRAPDLRTCGGFGTVPSRQLVTFAIHNGSGADRYIPTISDNCDVFEIRQMVGKTETRVPLVLGFRCPCECQPPSYYASHRRVLKPGDTILAPWDARSLITCTVDVDCAQQGWPGLGIRTMAVGASTPVMPGTYRFLIEAESTVPQSCDAYPGDYWCSSGGEPVTDARPGRPVCPADGTDAFAEATFTLPAMGDVTVPVELR